MKVAIISDIHANLAALQAFPESYDELWVVGDLVNFGPNPGEVVDWVRRHAHCVVRGNHDHAVAYGTDPRCGPAYQKMAAETGEYSAVVLTSDQKEYLRLLPLTAERRLAGARFHLCHAIPSDPLSGYLDESDWTAEVLSTHVDNLVVGHTHEPYFRKIRTVGFLNPGSLAGLRVTSPQASYAIWEDGQFQLKRYSYPVEETIAAIETMPISRAVKHQLTKLIMTGDPTVEEHSNV